MIAVKVKGIGLDDSQNPLLLLMDQEETLVLPIGIGASEAHAVTVKLEGQLSHRPMSHDLFTSVCWKLGATISKVIVSDIVDGTYFAQIYMDHNEETFVLDSRPSDGVVLALTVGIPLYITDKVAKHCLPFQEHAKEKLEDYQDHNSKFLH